MTLLALEIGPTGFAAARVAEDVDADDVRQVPLPADAAWERCLALLTEVAAGGDVTGLGIACAGPVDMAAGVVAPAEIAEWRTGFDIVEAARAAFPGAAVHLAVDGVCSALAERSLGATKEAMDSLSVTVAERISGGVTVGGFVVVGRTGNAGNIGHVLVPGYDELCECGGRGCLEAVAGGVAAMRWAQSEGWGGSSVAELVAAARIQDQVAVAAMARVGTSLGRAIVSVAALLDIDLVVVGGAVAEAGPALWEPLGAAVAAHARLSYLPGLRVVPSTLGDMGALAGAGLLALTPRR
ncbi:ROK family protein [Nocardia brasiliensis]|uniref:ROK family protein n=1 Tax=Nocardia brasiliensis TaxID=37326 RepID=UPI00245424F0|nr:ROK family protein [Nocardia brasiliensis]